MLSYAMLSHISEMPSNSEVVEILNTNSQIIWKIFAYQTFECMINTHIKI